MILEIKNITKTFAAKEQFKKTDGQLVRAVNDVSLVVQPMENLSLVGESGCGKTTLAKIIMRLIDADEGQIIFNHNEITNFSGKSLKPFRQHMQMVFQDPYNSLDPRFTVFQILEEAMTLDPRRYRTYESKNKRVDELLEAVHLSPQMKNRYPHEFSGGERQRISIARALVMSPKLILLDEALSSLDVIIQNEVITLLKELQQKFMLTYLFISHNLKVVKKLSHKIAVMYKGKIVEWGRCDQIFDKPLHPYTKVLLKAAIEYKSIDADLNLSLPSHSKLIEKAPGHFVLEEKH